MQKKIIALAVAAMASGAAFAQSNVTVYGVVDMGYVNASAQNSATGAQKFSGINSGNQFGSRLGFRGTEDLGNGLKALFTLEYGLAADVGAASWTGTARQSFLGLTGNFGTVVAGRLQNPGYNFALKYDTFGASINSPVGQLSDNAGLSISARDGLGRLDNAVAYVSPTFSGLTLVAAYAFGEQIKNNNMAAVPAGVRGDNTSPQAVWALAAEYAIGDLNVGVVYHDLNDIGGTNSAQVAHDRSEYGVGASYDFKVAKLSAMYQRSKDDNIANAANADDTIKLWQVGVGVPVGAKGLVEVGYGRLKNDRSAGRADQGAKVWALTYEHSLSKRTTAYAGYNRLNNDSNTAYTNLNTGVLTSNGKNASQFTVGMRHSF